MRIKNKRKNLWKKVKRQMGEERNTCRMKRSDGVLVKRNEETKEVRKSYFESVSIKNVGVRTYVTRMSKN